MVCSLERATAQALAPVGLVVLDLLPKQTLRIVSFAVALADRGQT